jgi:hypothetical protein
MPPHIGSQKNPSQRDVVAAMPVAGSFRQTNHNKGVCDGREDVDFAFEDEREDREDAAEEVNEHESE